MTTIEITYHDDQILNVDTEVREWLGERLMGHLLVAVRDGETVYSCPDGQPLRLGVDVPVDECSPLPDHLVERAALWLVADIKLPDGHSGFSRRLRPGQRDPQALAVVREAFEAYIRRCVDAHVVA